MSEILKTVNPATNEPLQSYDAMTIEKAGQIIDQTHAAFLNWRNTDFQTRSALFYTMADLLDERKNDYATLMMQEMGKIHKQGVAEIEKCAWACRYYAEHAAEFLADDDIATDFERSFVTFQPIGVILAIMPWNFPFWQVLRFAAPTLMAGNGAVLKHATSTTGCALAIEQLFIDAGFPNDIFRSLLVGGKKASDLIEHHHIRGVTLTGSTAAGRKVAERAGSHLKKTVLELGGSDGYIICDDANLENAAKLCTTGRIQNTGQSCIAAKRFIVVDSVYDEFLNLFKTEMESKTIGDPSDENSDLGPMSSIDLRDELHDQVERSVKAGAQCILGGTIPDKTGAWYPPTILTNVTEGMPAYHEELFGPVAIVIRAKDQGDAIRIANDSDFGLGGGVMTSDMDKGIEMARTQLDTGNVAVNGFVKSHPALPFGGVKDSGYGRELAAFGIREFVNVKTVTAAKI